jgi:SPP1 family predicted phage head-tail adaptor
VIAAGELTRSVTIRAKVSTPDEYGGETETTSDVATVRAKVEPLQGREQIDAMQTGMKAPHRFTIRYRTDVTGATEILYAGHSFDVASVVDPDARHRELVILADQVPS